MRTHGIKDYDDLIARTTSDIEWFWHYALRDLGIEWYEPYSQILDISKGFPWARWFIDGKLNLVHNTLDRHLPALETKPAFIWEPDSPDFGEAKTITYGALNQEVIRVAAALKELGLQKGDRIGLYMPMIPEMVSAFLATLKIGAVVIPIFSGFGSQAMAVRLNDAGAKLLFTADGSLRRGKKISIKKTADEGIAQVPTLQKVVVVQRLGGEVPMQEGRDLFWDDFLTLGKGEVPTERTEAEDHSLIVYTSGTTGKPKGTVHTHAGVQAQVAKELAYYFDLKPDDRFFWVTDIGWMMGPWEILGVMTFGGTFVIFEGAPDWPQPDRLWEIVEKHRLTHLGISPTAIRLLIKSGPEFPAKHDLSSLRILGSTGETWDPESYLWFFENIGGKRCPIINISGGTEIMGCHLAPLPITELKSCTLRGPGLGMDVDVWNEERKSVRKEVGYLVCKKPAPSMTKGFLNDPDRYLDTYFSKWPDIWNHGDWAFIDEDGFWFLRGRADDTIKVAGRRTGPAEIEAVLLEHPAVSEAAAIGVPHEVKGEEIVCFAVLKPGFQPSEELRRELKEQIVRGMGKALTPRDVRFIRALPKTRSAKIVRGALKKKFLGQPVGDLSSVENPESLEEIAKSF